LLKLVIGKREINFLFRGFHSPLAIPIIIGLALPLSYKERGKAIFRWLGVSEKTYDKIR
jgi:hypothetical protein